VRSVEETAEL